MKKIIFFIIVLGVMSLTIYMVCSNLNTKILKELDFSKVQTITIESLPPGTKTVIADKRQIIKIEDYIHSLKLKKDTAKFYNGINYRIYVNGDKDFLFSLSGEQLLYNNTWYYVGPKAIERFELLLK